jgi:hypothetical protein
MFYLPKGRKVIQRALMTPFLAIYAKGGESMSPKQKDRITTNFKKSFSIGMNCMIFNLVSSCVQKKGESSIFKINILKPS